MKGILTILSIAFLTLSCHRYTMPQASTVVKDSTDSIYSRKEKTVTKDTTITYPAHKIDYAVAIDSLINWLNKNANRDTVLDSQRKEQLHSEVAIKNGNLQFHCEADSLRKVIITLTNAYFELWLQRNKTEYKEVKIPEPYPFIKKYIPHWIWWYIGVTTLLLVITNLSVVKKSANGIKTFFNLFRK